ncbi:hypothetical protein ACKWTF_015243 [Chironomus riparius]
MILINLIVIFITFKNCNGYDRKFLKMENCTSTGKTAVIQDCEVRDNRVNAKVTILPSNKNSSNIRLSFKFYRLEKGIYKEIFRLPEVKGCLFTFSSRSSNPFVKVIMNMIKKYLPKTQICPFVGVVDIRELSLYDSVLFLIPPGTFRFTFHVSNENDFMAFWISLTFQIDH